MKRRIPAAIALALAMSTPACVSHGETLSDRLEDFSQELDRLASLANTHALAIQGTAGLEAITAEELSYSSATATHHGELSHMMDDMGQCSDGFAGPDMFGVSAGMDLVDGELARHRTNMAAASTISDAMSEEARHQLEMDRLVSAMHDEHAALVPESDIFDCDEHHHD